MKSITEFINEAHNTEWLKRAKTVDEPFVKAALEEEGYSVELATQDEDFKHIDLKVSTDYKSDDVDKKGITFVDVKRNSEGQKNSSNFTLTIKSDTGIDFPFDKNKSFAFIDDTDGTITLVYHDDIEKLVKQSKPRKSKFGGNSEYVILPKDKVKKLGKVIYPSNNVKRLLK